MITLALILTVAVLAPVIVPVDLAANDLGHRLQRPVFLKNGSEYLLGTDNLGRDVAIRLLYATRTTVLISFSGMLFALTSWTGTPMYRKELIGWRLWMVKRAVRCPWL